MGTFFWSLILAFSIACQNTIYADENVEATETLQTIVSNASAVQPIDAFIVKFLNASLKPNAYEDAQKLNENLRNEIKRLLDGVTGLSSVIDYSGYKNDLLNYFNNINEMYEATLSRRKRDAKMLHQEIDETVLDNSLSGIYRILANQDTIAFLTENLKEETKLFLNACRTKMSHIQVLDSLLAYAQIATAQYYTVLVSKSSNKNNPNVILLAKIQHYKIIANLYKGIMSTASREFWTCSSQSITKLMNLDRNYYFVQSRATSNFLQNRVVTGVRLIVEGSFIFIQIQEAKVLANGLIDNNTLHWVPLNKYKMLKYIEPRKNFLDSVDLTEIPDLPEGSVVTGLQFHKSDFTKRMKLIVYSREYNHETGSVNQIEEKSNTPSDATDEYELDDSNVAAADPEKVLPISKNNQYVSFKIVQNKDGGQNMIPFVDTQKVESVRPSPLSGVGLYLKGQPGYSDVSLALKLFSFNIEPFVDY